MIVRPIIAVISMSALLTGCLSKPAFNLWHTGKDDPPPGVGDLIRHLQCELFDAVRFPINLPQERKAELEQLRTTIENIQESKQSTQLSQAEQDELSTAINRERELLASCQANWQFSGRVHNK